MSLSKCVLVFRSTIICCSLTEDQAKLIIVMTLDYLEKHFKSYVCKGLKRPTQNKIELTNGSRIVARPVGTTGDAVRGFTGYVLILDEVSRFKELVMEDAKPTLLTTGGKLWIASTPFGRKGFFYECYLNKNNRFKVISVNSVDVVTNRALSTDWSNKQQEDAIKFLEQERKDMTKKQFGQEYLGLFVEDLQQFFPDNLLEKVCILKKEERRPRGDLFLGVDVARLGKDLSVLVSVEKIEDRVKQIDIEIIKKALTTYTTKRILEADARYNYNKIYIDDGGLGVAVFDPLLQHEQTRRKVVAINNASRSLSRDDTHKKRLLKEDLYNNLLRLIEQEKILLLDNEEIFNSLKSIQYDYDEHGNMTIWGNDSHIAEALIRAVWCMQGKSLSIWIKSI